MLGFVLISIVIPVYFNEKNLPETWNALSSTLATLPREHEHDVVFVDDGSRDGSYAQLLALHEKHPQHVRVANFVIQQLKDSFPHLNNRRAPR